MLFIDWTRSSFVGRPSHLFNLEALLARLVHLCCEGSMLVVNALFQLPSSTFLSSSFSGPEYGLGKLQFQRIRHLVSSR